MSLMSRPSFRGLRLPATAICYFPPWWLFGAFLRIPRITAAPQGHGGTPWAPKQGRRHHFPGPFKPPPPALLTRVLRLLQVRRHPVGVLWRVLHSSCTVSWPPPRLRVLQGVSGITQVRAATSARVPAECFSAIEVFRTKESRVRMRGCL